MIAQLITPPQAECHRKARQQVGTCFLEATICQVLQTSARPFLGLSRLFLQIVSVIWRDISADPVSTMGKALNVLHCLKSTMLASALEEIKFRPQRLS